MFAGVPLIVALFLGSLAVADSLRR